MNGEQSESSQSRHTSTPTTGANSIGSAAVPDQLTSTRWCAPEITDRPSFLRDHPQCVVTPDKLAELDHHIDRLADWMRRPGDELSVNDVRQEIVTRILECATHYRSLDDDGQPIFDFLDQEPTYIVRNAAGMVSSQLRRQRAQARLTVSYDAPIAVRSDGGDDDCDGDGLLAVMCDSSVAVDATRVELWEFALTLTDRLCRDHDSTLGQVWDLVLTGHDRRDIGALLGIRRQRVQERFAKLRTIILEMNETPGDDTLLLEVA
jgi:hypothetical protein